MSQSGKLIDASGTGDVVGPGSSTDKALVRFDGTTGKLIQNGVTVETDNGELRAGDGTASTPAYSFVSETGLGLYRSGAGTLSQSISGTDTWYSSATLFFHSTPVRFNSDVIFYNAMFYPNVNFITSASSPYTASVNDNVILINTTGAAITIRLPDSCSQGQYFVIKDANGTGAGTNNITVTTPGGTTTIDGSTSYVMNVDRASIQVMYNVTVGGYVII